MLVKIPLLSFLIFGITYPLFLLLSAKDPIKHNFHRFQLGCPVIMAGLAIIGLWFYPVPVDLSLKYASLFWLAAFLLITALNWNRPAVNPWGIAIVALWGLKVFADIYSQLISAHALEILISILSGFIVSSVFYAMNLGHFYLNVHGLNIKHLKMATIAFAVLLAVRLIWNIFYISTGQVIQGGEEISLLHFMMTVDGFFVWVALFFGTLFPLGASYFAFGTLKLKNTQATTGILYVLLSAVLLGDLAYKYYLLKYSIPL